MKPAVGMEGGPREAALAIIELINSRPSSPQPDEIAAIIEQTIGRRIPAHLVACSNVLDEYGPDISPVRS